MSENQRWSHSRNATEAHDLRLLLAVLRTEIKLVRLRRSLSRKYDPDQPRTPERWRALGGGRLRLLDEPLRAGDRDARFAILRRWEAETIVGSPLEPYWSPGQYPF